MSATGLQLLLRPASAHQGTGWISALFAGAARGLADLFERELGARIGVRCESLTTTALASIMPRVADKSVGASLRVGDARERAFLFVGRDAVFDLCDISFGGDGGEPPYRDVRDFTPLEKQVGRYLIEKFLAATLRLAEGAPPQLVIDRLETRTESLAVPAYERGAVATFVLTIFQRETHFYVLLPDELLPSVQKPFAYLAKDPEEHDADRDWTRKLEAKVKQADILLRISLKEAGHTLADVANFRPGQTLTLAATPRTPVMIEADGAEIFSCQLGQADGRYTVRIEDEVTRGL